MIKEKNNESSEILKTNVSWFHFFKTLIHSGKWAEMSAPAKAVYPVIKAFTDPISGYTAPNYKLLIKYSGISSKTSISLAIKELEKMGQITRIETPGKTTKYKCREQFEIVDEFKNTVAISDFDYMSKFVKAATDELSEQIKLNLPGHKLNFINIERIIINVAGDIISGNADKSTININLRG
jgi:hypothetical protein